MHAWIGPARVLFIPLIVKDTKEFEPPPDDFEELIRRRVYFDPDPDTGEDQSLSSYINSISYGRAWLDATVSAPVTLTKLKVGDSATLLAINAQPEAHLYEYLAVVFPTNTWEGIPGMAQPGQIQFSPPRTPNLTKGRCRFNQETRVGTWAMELLHITTGIGDYYNGINGVENFDEMDGAIATHPTAYTKRIAGWLDEKAVPLHLGKRSYTLHAVGLPQPPPAGRVTAVRVQAPGSQRYLFIEARLRCDRWEAGVGDSFGVGIPWEGVLIYEFSPESDSWPRRPQDPNGPWPPLEFRKAGTTAGQSYTYPADGTVIRVGPATAGGFNIGVTSKEVDVPSVLELPREVAKKAIENVGLRPVTTGASGPNAWVWRQSPREGTRVPTGSAVRLQLRISPPPIDRNGEERPPRRRRSRRK
jgi:PASTA domain